MDQDASNKDADDQSRPISPQSPAEQPEVADTTMDQVTTPEAEMDIDLPHLSRMEAMVDTKGKKIRMEIPDSEEASEVSSPVKVGKEEEEKRDETADPDGGAQTVQVASEQGVGQDDTPKGQGKAIRAEIPDSEEASEFSSPVKLGMGGGAYHDGAVQVDGGLESVGELQEQHVEEGDTTMMDVCGPAQEEGMAEGSRAADGAGVDVAMMPVIGTTKSVEATKEMENTVGEYHGLPSTVNMDSDVGQATLQEGTQDALSTDTSLQLDKTNNPEQGMQSTAVNCGGAGPQTTPVKGDAGAMELSTKPNAQGPLESPGTVAKDIAIAARKLLGE
jgi:hypothetical protein